MSYYIYAFVPYYVHLTMHLGNHTVSVQRSSFPFLQHYHTPLCGFTIIYLFNQSPTVGHSFRLFSIFSYFIHCPSVQHLLYEFSAILKTFSDEVLLHQKINTYAIRNSLPKKKLYQCEFVPAKGSFFYYSLANRVCS
jgi:hypothetical protein